MPPDTLPLQTLANRLDVLATRLQATLRRHAWPGRDRRTALPQRVLATTTRWRALPATTRWLVLGAAATGLMLLTMYVMTLQAAVERGEALREQRRVQGVTSYGSASPPARLQTASPGSAPP